MTAEGAEATGAYIPLAAAATLVASPEAVFAAATAAL